MSYARCGFCTVDSARPTKLLSRGVSHTTRQFYSLLVLVKRQRSQWRPFHYTHHYRLELNCRTRVNLVILLALSLLVSHFLVALLLGLLFSSIILSSLFFLFLTFGGFFL